MKKRVTALVGSIVIVGLLVSVGGTVIAQSTSTASTSLVTQTQASTQGQDRTMHRGGVRDGQMSKGKLGVLPEAELQAVLASMVKLGAITQSESDKVTAFIKAQQTSMEAEKAKVDDMTQAERKTYFEQKKATAEKKMDLLSQLVSNGIITQVKADAIKVKMQEAQKASREQDIKTQLEGLIQKKTITLEQVDKILVYMDKQEANRKAEMAKVRAMTQTEREQYFAAHPKSENNLSSELVTAGILTQTQAEAVSSVLDRGHGHNGMRGIGGRCER